MKNIFVQKKLVDDEQNRIAQILNTFLLAAIFGLIVIVIERLISQKIRLIPIVGLSITFLIISLYFLRKTKVTLSAIILFSTLFVLVTYLALSGQKLRDSALFGVPGLLMMAAIILKRQYFYALLASSVIMICVIGYVDINRIMIGEEVFTPTNYLDVIDLLVIFTITAIASKLISNNLIRSLAKAKENEVKSRISEEKNRALISALPDIVFRIDSRGKFLDMSVPIDIKLYVPYDKVIGSSISKVMPSDVANKSLSCIRNALESKQVEIFEYNLELDGYITEWEARIIALNDSEVISVIRDVTESKRAERELRHSESKFKGLVSSMQDLVYTLDKDLKVTGLYGQWSEMYGITEDILGKKFESFMSPGEAELNNIACIKALSGEPVRFEWSLNKKNDQKYHFENSLTPYYDRNNTVIGIVCVARDITARKSIEKELIKSKKEAEEADKLKSSLLANMSHEIRTPLNGILGYSQLMLEELTDPSWRNMVSKIELSAKRLMDTLNSVITLTELQNSSFIINETHVNIPEVCLQIKYAFQQTAQEKGVKLIVEYNNSDLSTISDEDLLIKAMWYLVNNAVKYTQKGQVIIHPVLDINKQKILINIIDSGIGIKNDDLEKIFGEFKQISEGIRRNYEGLGLGLAISKKISKLLNGNIFVESELGKGSVFTLEIPYDINIKSRSDLEVTVNPDEYLPMISNKKESPRFLIVEDNALNAEVVEMFLSGIANVDKAYSGETALKMAFENNYQLILIDIHLGNGIDGIELLKEIKKIDRYKSVHAIAATGYATSQNKRDFLANGFTNYLAKPFNKNELLDVIANELKMDSLTKSV